MKPTLGKTSISLKLFSLLTKTTSWLSNFLNDSHSVLKNTPRNTTTTEYLINFHVSNMAVLSKLNAHSSSDNTFVHLHRALRETNLLQCTQFRTKNIFKIYDNKYFLVAKLLYNSLCLSVRQSVRNAMGKIVKLFLWLRLFLLELSTNYLLDIIL